MLIKERIANDLSGNLFDANCPTRRFFRCWLDGSYNGEEHYRRNVAFIQKNKDDKRRMRSFVISEFVLYTACDSHCSPSYAAKMIKEIVPANDLERLNDELIEDALDLVEDM